MPPVPKLLLTTMFIALGWQVASGQDDRELAVLDPAADDGSAANSGSTRGTDPDSQTGASIDPPADEVTREVSWKKIIPNLASDQKNIWLFPLRAAKGKYLWPTLAVMGTTAALIALDPHDAPYFRKTSAFGDFNSVFSGNNTALGTVVAPAALYVSGLISKDKKMQRTALLAGEALADSEVVATVMKDIDRRLRPAAISPNGGNFTDTWFKDTRYLRSNGSFPSGHTIAAFAIATVIARQYRNHRWVPYVAYGGAALVGFSRVSLQSHFVSDVFMGGALGYSIARFTVLRQ